MVEVYRGTQCRPCFLVTLELALGKASWTPGSITLNGTTLPMHDGQIAVPFPSRDEFKSLSLSALLTDGATMT